MSSQAEKNKVEAIEFLDYLKARFEAMSDECFEDYGVYAQWRPNIKEDRSKSISQYSGTGSPPIKPPQGL